MRKQIVQKMRKREDTPFQIAQKYYGIISVLNGLGLTEREIELLSFSATRGSVSVGNVKEEFCERFDTSLASVNNIVSRLKKKGVLMKRNGKVFIVPPISLDFSKNVTLEVNLDHGE